MNDRSSMRRWLLSLAVILTVLVAAHPALAAPPKKLDVNERVGPKGGTIQIPEIGFSISFPPGALKRQTHVKVHVARDQFHDLDAPGFVLSPRGIELRLDIKDVAPSAVITLRLDFPGQYDPVATTMGVATDRGFTLALPSQRSGQKQLVGALDQPTLSTLSKHARHGKDARVRVFTANAALLGAPILVTSVSQFVYDPSTGTGTFGHPLSDLTNKRVALCVHGLATDLADLNELAAYLAAYTRPGDSQPYYDAIIGFQYTSNVPLAEIGSAMAEFVGQSIDGVAALDVFSHSMGTVVSRYAIEVGGTSPRLGPLPGGGHYVSLGGPQVGVPFGDLPSIITLLLIFGFSAKPCIVDLITDGQGGAPETGFLSTLNPGTDGPDRATAAYFSLSANDFAAEAPPVGDIVNHLYLKAVPPRGVVNDGLVAVYSAQSPALGLQSASWQPGQTFAVSHHELVTSTTVFQAIGNLIASW